MTDLRTLDAEVHRVSVTPPPEPANAARSSRTRPVLRFLIEIAAISLGVFLGLAGIRWREHAQARAVAQASLRRVRAEVFANRNAIAAVSAFHVTSLRSVRAYLAANGAARPGIDLQGMQPASFQHAAWDLAGAAGSLAGIDADVLTALSRIYNEQRSYADLTRGVRQAMYLLPPVETSDAFVRAVSMYLDRLVVAEPRLMELYADVLPRLDRALGEPSGDEPVSPDEGVTEGGGGASAPED